MQGLHILSLGREDPLEEEITTHSSIIFYLFPLFLIIYFNWRIITLQYCSVFCYTSTWINHGYTCVPASWTPLPPPSSSHLSGSCQCTSPKHPVSCIQSRLVICFTLWTFPLGLLLPCPTGFGLLCFHFHPFLCKFLFLFWFLLWFVGYSAACCSAPICWNF